jgi:hypothetical protein
VTTWFERRPGSEETLLAMYDAVQAAEELDLAEQAHDESFRAEVRAFYDWPSDEANGPADSGDDEEVGECERVTMSQAVGVIEHLLGGRPMRSGGKQVS